MAPMAPGPSAPADPARGAAIGLAIAAVLILIGTVSKSWITGGGGSSEFHLGPMGAEVCFQSICREVSGRAAKMPGDVELVQMLALIGGFASVAAAGAFGGLVLAGKRDKLPAPKLGNVAFGLTAFAMTYFEIRVLGEGHRAGFGWAPIPGIGGVVLAGVMLRKLIPHLPARPAPLPGQAPQGMYGHGGQASQPMAPQQMYGAQASQPMAPQGMYAGQASQPMAPQQMYGHAGQASQPMAPQQAVSQQAPQQAAPPQAQAPQAHGAPGCPRCGTPLQFVAQYQRWFCPREQQYV